MTPPTGNGFKAIGSPLPPLRRQAAHSRRGKRPRMAARIHSWGEADALLGELGRLVARLQRVEQRRAQAIARAEVAVAQASQGLEERRRQLESALERFCWQHQGELERVNGHSRRSRRLLFGRVGYRASHAVLVRSELAALRALAQWRAGQQFLRLRTALDREGLRRFLLTQQLSGNGLDPLARRLGRVGIRLEGREGWFYELDRAAIARWG